MESAKKLIQEDLILKEIRKGSIKDFRKETLKRTPKESHEDFPFPFPPSKFGGEQISNSGKGSIIECCIGQKCGIGEVMKSTILN